MGIWRAIIGVSAGVVLSLLVAFGWNWALVTALTLFAFIAILWVPLLNRLSVISAFAVGTYAIGLTLIFASGGGV